MCDDRTELKFEDRVREDTNQEKYEKQLIKIDENPIEKRREAKLSDYETEDCNPETMQEAVNFKDSTNWKKAIESEMNSLRENHTWELTDLPAGAKAISCKWIYRLKTNPKGSLNKYKASLVARGFNQRQGIDYSETYSPVTKLGKIRTVLSMAAEERMHLIQFDVSTSIPYGDLEETIYMQQSENFKDGTERVCKLKRSLCGLK
ncbi:retrovirus-related Pol polyprotein from transposon TNT 1-94 [Trichonephila clavipes]|nr:retrovirus-related Pol polyprotein from transposon TNT 1-94 [Trichonephila clavipes]